MQTFLKWAGGKGQLLPQLIHRMPRQFKRYYEPFIGGGALLLALEPKSAVINDINPALTNVYRQIRDNRDIFLEAIHLLDSKMWSDGKSYYQRVRSLYNAKLMKSEFDATLAAMFMFLNKHCYNGLYRVNGGGHFNVAYNGKRGISVEDAVIFAASSYLSNVTIMTGDFENVCKDASAGDFIFLDSPYAPMEAATFISYTTAGFERKDHERVAALYHELTQRGCYCMLTNHNSNFIRGLYKDYIIEEVGVRRSISSDGNKRGGTEVIVRNYRIV